MAKEAEKTEKPKGEMEIKIRGKMDLIMRGKMDEETFRTACLDMNRIGIFEREGAELVWYAPSSIEQAVLRKT